MKRLVILLAVATMFAVCYVGNAFAGANPDAKVVLHVRAHDLKVRCTSAVPTPTNCGELVLSGNVGVGYDVQILVADFLQLRAVEFGICYQLGQLAIMGSRLDCWPGAVAGTSPNPPWPMPGSGAVIALPFPGCYPTTGALLNIGFLYAYAYAPTTLRICGSPRAGTVEVVDCQGQADQLPPDHLGWVGFGQPGYDGACGRPTAAENNTWGNIKALYR